MQFIFLLEKKLMPFIILLRYGFGVILFCFSHGNRCTGFDETSFHFSIHGWEGFRLLGTIPTLFKIKCIHQTHVYYSFFHYFPSYTQATSYTTVACSQFHSCIVALSRKYYLHTLCPRVTIYSCHPCSYLCAYVPYDVLYSLACPFGICSFALDSHSSRMPFHTFKKSREAGWWRNRNGRGGTRPQADSGFGWQWVKI